MNAFELVTLAASDPQDYQSVFYWSLALLGLLVAGAAAVYWVKRRFGPGDDEDDAAAAAGGTGFTLSDLRRLHRQGQLTDEEFERAKSQMLAAYHRAAERDKRAASPPPPSRARRDDGADRDDQGPAAQA